MAITSGDWSSSTDPFILALDHDYTGTVGHISSNYIEIQNSEGFINAIVNDKDVQEIFWSKDGDPDKSWPVNAFVCNGTGPGFGYKEFGQFEQNIGSGFITFSPEELIQADPKGSAAYTTGKASGSTLYSLFAFTAYTWQAKDPAQIIFSWVAHHCDSLLNLKNQMDQTSFQDASDYYDDNPCPLSLTREAGLTIAEQIKKVMSHTPDYLVICPGSAGSVHLHFKTRRSGMNDRPTLIDLNSDSIKSYTFRPTDQYTIDRLTASFGSIAMVHAPNDDPSDFILPPVEFPSENRNSSNQKVNGEESERNVDFACPYHLTREGLLSHLDIGFWADNQDEFEIEWADLLHFNFEAGDIVHITGRGHDGTEDYLVTEKTIDLDTLLGTARFMRVRGNAGKPPRYADTSNLILWQRPNTLGLHFDGTISFPKDVPVADGPRNFDRLWSEAEYSHASAHTRGNVGPGAGPPGPWPLNANKRNGWPGFALATETGLEISYDLTDGRGGIVAPAGNYTFYWVGNPTDVGIFSCLFDMDDGGTDTVAFAVSGPSGGVGNVQFYDGTWRGSNTSITGWQILVFVLDSTGSKIRRNGADINTGLSYTQRAMSTGDDYGLGVNAAGTSGVFKGDWMECALFKGAHSAAVVSSIEAHLAEKYNISI